MPLSPEATALLAKHECLPIVTIHDDGCVLSLPARQGNPPEAIVYVIGEGAEHLTITDAIAEPPVDQALAIPPYAMRFAILTDIVSRTQQWGFGSGCLRFQDQDGRPVGEADFFPSLGGGDEREGILLGFVEHTLENGFRPEHQEYLEEQGILEGFKICLNLSKG